MQQVLLTFDLIIYVIWIVKKKIYLSSIQKAKCNIYLFFHLKFLWSFDEIIIFVHIKTQFAILLHSN